MSTLKVNAISNVAGTGSPNITEQAKAWVNFNGTGTVAIRGDFNVTSITDNGTGQYTVNFTNAMADANYSVNISGSSQTTFANHGVRAFSTTDFATGSVRVSTSASTSATTDFAVVGVAIFR